MVKVAVKTRERAKGGWDIRFIEMSRVPCVGEHVAPTANDGVFEITLVIHCPFPTADCVAEVYGVGVDEKALVARQNVVTVGAG